MDWSPLTTVFPGARPPVCLDCPPATPVTPCPEALAPLLEVARPGRHLTVVINDQTRKAGTASLLAVLCPEWARRGVGPAQLTLLVACGSHRAPEPAELDAILGTTAESLRSRVRVHQAFSADTVRLGVTRRGTPVEVNRQAVAAECLVTLGAVTFHYFAGFTGGRKSIVPGLASAATIAANHSLAIAAATGAFRAGVELGRLGGNPLAEDLEEAAALVPVAATAQTVLNGDGQLAGLCCGALLTAHRAACRRAGELFAVPLAERADLVLAAAGAARNWVQSHKALVNADRAVAEGGVVVLLAPCPEGLGSASLRQWLEHSSPQALLAALPGCADINAQTALSTRLRGRRAILVAPDAPPELALAGMPVARDLETALRLARARLRVPVAQAPRVLWLPNAWLTVPCPPDLPLPVTAVH